jgi:hypothetical protein
MKTEHRTRLESEASITYNLTHQFTLIPRGYLTLCRIKYKRSSVQVNAARQCSGTCGHVTSAYIYELQFRAGLQYHTYRFKKRACGSMVHGSMNLRINDGFGTSKLCILYAFQYEAVNCM